MRILQFQRISENATTLLILHRVVALFPNIMLDIGNKGSLSSIIVIAGIDSTNAATTSPTSGCE